MIVKPQTWYRDGYGWDVYVSSRGSGGAFLGYHHTDEKPVMFAYNENGEAVGSKGEPIAGSRCNLVRELTAEEIEQATRNLQSKWYAKQ